MYLRVHPFTCTFQVVRVTCDPFCTEGGYDFLKVSDGEGPVVRMSGCQGPQTAVTRDRHMYGNWTSDASITTSGFHCVLESGKRKLSVVYHCLSKSIKVNNHSPYFTTIYSCNASLHYSMTFKVTPWPLTFTSNVTNIVPHHIDITDPVDITDLVDITDPVIYNRPCRYSRFCYL